jgi:hypothetical protein
MAKGLSFRKDCSECGRTFLTPDRKVKLCSACTAKVVEREAQRKKAEQKQAKKTLPSTKLSQETPTSGPPLPDELEAQILKEYEVYREDQNLTRTKVHGLIAKKFKVKKMLVAQVLRATADGELPVETEKEILRRYQGYVTRLERPARGRRKTIAGEMGISFQAVALSVRKWNRQCLRLKELTREKRFLIEKLYWQNLENGKSLPDSVEEIALKIGCPPLLVYRYLDFIHEGEDRLQKIPDVSVDQKEAILAGYAAYLEGDAPPDLFLHTLLAEKAGVGYQQVHKVLLNYRLERLRGTPSPPWATDT